MRKKEREILEQGKIEEIIKRCEILHLGLSVNNKPYVVPLNFGYSLIDDKWTFYCHGAGEGRKIDMIKENPSACFQMDRMIDIKRAEKPCGWTAYFESIIGEGQVTILTDEKEKEQALNYIMDKYGYEGKPAYSPKMLARTCIIKIDALTISAKAT